MITEIRYRSKWVALKDFSIGIGSHSMNPNTTSLHISKGDVLTWEDDAPNGNVWFNVEGEGYGNMKHRGKVESGRITNVIIDGWISLLDNGNGNIAYQGEYLQKLLNR
jgi:hypothetical protein